MTTKTKGTHTPGPWKYERITIGHPDNWRNPIVTAPGNYIARLFCAESTVAGMTADGLTTLDEAEANAALIAAAPDLLEACQLVADHCGDHGDERSFRAIKAARAAIAKATA